MSGAGLLGGSAEKRCVRLEGFTGTRPQLKLTV